MRVGAGLMPLGGVLVLVLVDRVDRRPRNPAAESVEALGLGLAHFTRTAGLWREPSRDLVTRL